MVKENFLLVSLKEDQAKKLAQVISNESCRKILDYLAEKEDATETEISKKLNLPISTVHYNLQHLVDSGVVTVEEFHYSKKGKEVNHYKLANKYIIISPRTTFGIKQKLRNILPVAGLSIIAAWFVNLFSDYFYKKPVTVARMATDSFAEAPVIQEAAKAVSGGSEIAEVTTSFANNIGLWFLIGALFAIIVYLIFDYIKKK